MGFFEKLAENSFKVSGTGETVFYPNGAMGKGRLVPDGKTRHVLLKFQARLYKLGFFVLLPYGWFLSHRANLNVVTLAPFFLFLFYFLYRQHILIRGLQKHELKLSFNEFFRERSKVLPNWYFWMLGISSVGAFFTALFLPAFCRKPFSEFLLPVAAMASLAIAGLVMSITMYRIRNAACNASESSDL